MAGSGSRTPRHHQRGAATSGDLAAVSRVFAERILQGDRQQAIDLIDQQIRVGRNPRQLLLEVVAPALWAVGDGWQKGRLTVADEHLATAIVQVAMAHLFDVWAVRRRPRCGRTLVGACPGREQHDIGLRMLCDLAEDEGWNTYFLGGAVPLDSLIAIVRKLGPHAVVLSGSLPEAVADLQASIDALKALPLPERPTIVVGGQVLTHGPIAAGVVGADHVTDDLVMGLDWLMERFHVGR